MSKNISLQGRGICHYQRLRAQNVFTRLLLDWCVCVSVCLLFFLLAFHSSSFVRIGFRFQFNKKLLARTKRVAKKKWRKKKTTCIKRTSRLPKKDWDCARHSCLRVRENERLGDLWRARERNRENYCKKHPFIRRDMGPLRRMDLLFVCLDSSNISDGMIWNKYI